ncbi:MAG: RNA methyltransferase [Bacteroidia bacterium]|nr:RNA methyltransferase [Bacteroidia bacterium]MDW8302995.1 RNA methyltransferase [Bacteroidia bacterium]
MSEPLEKLKLDKLNRLSIEAFKQSKKFPAVVIVENVRSAMNVGSIFRTCDAFAIEKLYLCGYTPTPPHKDIMRTALGSIESVNWEHYHQINSLLQQLKSDGYTLIALEQTNKSTLLQNLPAVKPAAFIVGNEVDGVSQETLLQCDTIVEIPQFGTKHSLNVSVATGIVLWHWLYISQIQK